MAPNSTKTVGTSWESDAEEELEEEVEEEVEEEEGTAGSCQPEVVGSSMPRRCPGARRRQGVLAA